jgi:hypothetical protein
MRVFKPALTAACFILIFGAIFVASFALTATLHKSLASITLAAASPG